MGCLWCYSWNVGNFWEHASWQACARPQAAPATCCAVFQWPVSEDAPARGDDGVLKVVRCIKRQAAAHTLVIAGGRPRERRDRAGAPARRPPRHARLPRPGPPHPRGRHAPHHRHPRHGRARRHLRRAAGADGLCGGGGGADGAGGGGVPRGAAAAARAQGAPAPARTQQGALLRGLRRHCLLAARADCVACASYGTKDGSSNLLLACSCSRSTHAEFASACNGLLQQRVGGAESMHAVMCRCTRGA